MGIDVISLIFLLVVLGLCVYLFLYVILPLIPLPPPFVQVITILVWLLVAWVFFERVLRPLVGNLRI